MTEEQRSEVRLYRLQGQIVRALLYVLLIVACVNLFVWRWNHEAVRLYDAPSIPWWF